MIGAKLLAVYVFILTPHLLYGHGDLHLVIKELDQKIKASPQDAGLFLQRASYHRKHGDFQLALRDAKHAQILQPKLIDQQLLCARIYTDQKDWNRAKNSLDAYIKVRPKDASALAFRSKICTILNLDDQAESDIQKAIKLQNLAPLPFYLQYVDLQLKNSQLEAAIEVYAEAEKSLGPLPTLLTSKAHMLRDHDRPAEASHVYSKLRKTNPKLAFIWWMEEAEMWQNQNVEKAKQALYQAKQSWKNLPERTRKLPHIRQQYKSMLSKS